MQDNEQRGEVQPRSITLRDGRSVLVRMIRPDDLDGIKAAFEQLCPEARYSRFFTTVRAVPEDIVDWTIHPAPERCVALIALSGKAPAQTVVGGARYITTPGTDGCEFAVTVADDWHGLSLARQLMETLIATARARGLRHMEGHVLSANMGMRGLADRLGFTDAPCPGDYTLRELSLRLD
ncbi:N-acetyltransferase family protein [Dyella soli]|uniref:GNAT family N-acetyltransferase n=1 Tax=Dyella soli TaxID=522319 RepID=A0A4R0YQS4_9GAMM|nr:GNAT family N-acetyltransferase [Dyella soli]TCI08825.1 GNAT family N-acetyltransferase [Dyella soli]